MWAERQEAYSLPLSAWLIEQCGVSAGQHVLDAGCGAGGAMVLAAERGARVTGTDVAPEMLAIARSRVPAGEFIVTDTEALPFADAAFDVSLAANSLQFTEHPVVALRELARVTKRGGLIGICCFAAPEHSNFATLGAAVRKLFVQPPHFEGPFSLSPPAKLFDVISQAGLVIRETAEIDLVRSHAHFEELWEGQSGAGATRYSVSQLGAEPVKQAMAAAAQQFTDESGKLTLSNRFVVVVASTAIEKH